SSAPAAPTADAARVVAAIKAAIKTPGAKRADTVMGETRTTILSHLDQARFTTAQRGRIRLRDRQNRRSLAAFARAQIQAQTSGRDGLPRARGWLLLVATFRSPG